MLELRQLEDETKVEVLKVEKMGIIEITKTGFPAMWECGGSEGKIGAAQIIGGKHAEELIPVYTKQHGTTSCEEHDLVVVRPGCVVVQMFRRDRRYTGTISKVVGTKETGYSLEVISRLRYDNGIWTIPPGNLALEGYKYMEPMVAAAKRKTNLFHCRYSIYTKWYVHDEFLQGRIPTVELFHEWITWRQQELETELVSFPIRWFEQQSFPCRKKLPVRKYFQENCCFHGDVLDIIEHGYYEGEFDNEILQEYFYQWRYAGYRPSSFSHNRPWLYNMKKERFSRCIIWASPREDYQLPDFTNEQCLALDIYGENDLQSFYLFDSIEESRSFFQRLHDGEKLFGTNYDEFIAVAWEKDIPELQHIKDLGYKLYSIDEYVKIVDEWTNSYVKRYSKKGEK